MDRIRKRAGSRVAFGVLPTVNAAEPLRAVGEIRMGSIQGIHARAGFPPVGCRP